jgi:hypothetical protein
VCEKLDGKNRRLSLRNGDDYHAGKIPKRRLRRPAIMVLDGSIAGIIGFMSVLMAEEADSA